MSIKLYPVIILLLTAFALNAQKSPAATQDTPSVLKINSPAPDFSLPGTDGATHSLAEYAASKVLVIVFTCNHCPVSENYERRIKSLAADYGDRGVTVIAISPTDPKSLRPGDLRYSDVGDSLAEMKIRAQYRQFNFTYLFDGDTQAVSRRFGPVATPHVFIFDQVRKLRYQGRLDDSQAAAPAAKHEAKDAIDALLAGSPVKVASTPVVGCAVNWTAKGSAAAADAGPVSAAPAHVEMAGIDQIKDLRRNTTKKFLLINFWATWCAPCEDEFPEVQSIYRDYRQRPFDVVMVSTNDPDDKEGVLKFLNQQHAVTRNYLFNVSDPIDIIAAFGADFNGGVPFTVLLAPDSRVIYEKLGEIDPLELRRLILKNLPDDPQYRGIREYWNSSF